MESGKIIVVANQKGGVAKTSTVRNLSYALAEMGKKVLVVDFDPQYNLTTSFGVLPTQAPYNTGTLITNLLLDESLSDTNEFIQKIDSVDLIPSSRYLTVAEANLLMTPDSNGYLATLLAPLRMSYDYIIVDTNPSLGSLTINALTAADEVIIPIDPELFALTGLQALMDTIKKIKQKLNPRIDIGGILFTKCNKRTNLYRRTYGQVAKAFQSLPSNGVLTGKPGTVYDVNIKYNSPEGKKTYSKKGFATKKEAAQHEAEMKVKLSNPVYTPVIASQGKQTVKEYLEEWVENHGKANLRPSTFASYKSHIKNHIVPYVGHVQLNQLTPAMLDNMFQQLFDKGLSNSTVRYAQRILSVSMEHARKYHYIEHNPARDVITKFGKQGKTPDPYTVEQMQQFMSNVIGTEWEMPVVLAGMYGLRMSEIIGLRTFNIDLEKMQFGVVEQMPFKVPPGTKTITEMAPTKSNDRILPITEETLPYFLRQFDLIERQKALIEASGGVYYDNKLFIAKPDGSPQRRDRMSANFGQLIRHLEMPHIRFHDLRHTAATNMHQLTGDFYTVGEILGHTLKGIGMSLGISTNLEAVTAQYVNVRLERKKAVLETYHKALHPQKPTPDKGSEPKKAKKKSSEIEL